MVVTVEAMRAYIKRVPLNDLRATAARGKGASGMATR